MLSVQLNADCSDESPPDYEMTLGGPSVDPVISGASEITVNESSVELELVERPTDPNVDLAPQAEENYIISSSKSDMFCTAGCRPVCRPVCRDLLQFFPTFIALRVCTLHCI